MFWWRTLFAAAVNVSAVRYINCCVQKKTSNDKYASWKKYSFTFIYFSYSVSCRFCLIQINLFRICSSNLSKKINTKNWFCDQKRKYYIQYFWNDETKLFLNAKITSWKVRLKKNDVKWYKTVNLESINIEIITLKQFKFWMKFLDCYIVNVN